MVPIAQRVLFPGTPAGEGGALELGTQNLVAVNLPPVSILASHVRDISEPCRLVGYTLIGAHFTSLFVCQARSFDDDSRHHLVNSSRHEFCIYTSFAQ